jgi:hypothetical protein
MSSDNFAQKSEQRTLKNFGLKKLLQNKQKGIGTVEKYHQTISHKTITYPQGFWLKK